MVEIQLDMYTADSISAHRKIRQDGFFVLLTRVLILSCKSDLVYAQI